MRALCTSRYLQLVPRSQDIAAYHSLFGDLLLIDTAGEALLRHFETPQTPDTAIAAFSGLDADRTRQFINVLRLRRFLMPPGSDEYELVETHEGTRRSLLQSGYYLRQLQLVVTNRCNLACEYCFARSIYSSEKRLHLQSSRANDQMSPETSRTALDAVLGVISKNGAGRLDVEFFGGEPLMGWPTIAYVLEQYGNRSDDVQLAYSITTNGHVLTEEMARLLRQHRVTVTISCDAPSGRHLHARGPQKGDRRVRQSLETLQRLGCWVTFNSVLAQETLANHDGVALVDLASRYGVRMIGLILDLDLDFYQDPDNREKMIDELWKTYQYGRSSGVPIVGYWHQIFSQIIGAQPSNLRSGYKTCPATGCKLSVEPSGDVFICKCCSGHLGQIDKLEEVLQHPLYEAYAMRAFRHAPACKGCEIEGFCSGVCMGALEKRYQRLDVVEPASCSVFRGITRRLIEHMDASDIEVGYLERPATRHAG